MPALRERREDIPLLLDHYLRIYNNRFGKRIVLSSDVVRALMNYDFPGNVRELENIVERCVSLSTEDTITRDALPGYIVKEQLCQPSRIKLSEVAAEAEKAHIVAILKSTKGNKTRTAEILGISRKNLWEKLKAYRIKQ
jgi:transcriptional regulator with PAS, ATPase and Fis domain